MERAQCLQRGGRCSCGVCAICSGFGGVAGEEEDVSVGSSGSVVVCEGNVRLSAPIDSPAAVAIVIDTRGRTDLEPTEVELHQLREQLCVLRELFLSPERCLKSHEPIYDFR